MRIVLGIVIVAIAFLGALYFSGIRYAVHQKITLSINTPDGPKSASSVQRAYLDKTLPNWMVPIEASGAQVTLSGEAVVLEIAPGRYVFVLLKSTPLAWQVFYPKVTPLVLKDKMAAATGQTRELTRHQYPLLVTFGDINDPASVSHVDPQNLAASFGPGYSLDAITMAITDEPVTEGKVEKVLGWWTQYVDHNGRMISLRYPNSSPRGYDTLTPLDFWSLNNIPQ